MSTLLHLDDDELFSFRCAQSFRTSHHVAHLSYRSVHKEEDFFSQLKQERPKAILLDLSFGGSALQGLEVLSKVRQQGFSGPIVMMSALSSADIILQCLRAGATDFLSKGLDESELTFRIGRILQSLSTHPDTSNDQPHHQLHVSGRSLREVQQRMCRVVKSSVRSVLVTGESGTGKEMAAEILRSLLPAGSPFITVNCAALSSHLIESEIFGHEKGAFTGAAHAKIGLYEAADGGWIFLDEVARLSLAAQAALLRALENGEVRPVGGTRTKKVQVRVFAATNEALDLMVDRGEFRADLLARLRGYEIHLLPFRARSVQERQEIIESLVDRLNALLSLEDKEFRLTHSCLTVLRDLSWRQGNIRELWQVLQSMSVDATDGVLSLEYLPQRLFQEEQLSQKKSPLLSTTTVASTDANSSTTTSADLDTNSRATAIENETTMTADPLQSRSLPAFSVGFPVNFEALVDQLFEHLWQEIKRTTGEVNPSQRTVAQLLNITRHEAIRRISRMGPKSQNQ